jgi:hypothetical protein
MLCNKFIQSLAIMDIIQGFIGIFFTDGENNLSNSLNKILFTTSKPGNLLKSCMEFNSLKLIIIL